MAQSKRLYGLIGSGEVLATILGGLVAAAVVRQIGTLNLLLITAAGLAGALGLLLALKQHLIQPSAPVRAHEERVLHSTYGPACEIIDSYN